MHSACSWLRAVVQASSHDMVTMRSREDTYADTIHTYNIHSRGTTCYIRSAVIYNVATRATHISRAIFLTYSAVSELEAVWTKARACQVRLSQGVSMTAFCAAFWASAACSASGLAMHRVTASRCNDPRAFSRLPSPEMAVPARTASAPLLSPCWTFSFASVCLSSGRDGSASTAFCAMDSAWATSPCR